MKLKHLKGGDASASLCDHLVMLNEVLLRANRRASRFGSMTMLYNSMPRRDSSVSSYSRARAMRFSYSGLEMLFSQSLMFDCSIPRVSATCFCVKLHCCRNLRNLLPNSINKIYQKQGDCLTNMCSTHIIMAVQEANS